MSRASTEEAEIMDQLTSESQLWSHKGASEKDGKSGAITPVAPHESEQEGKSRWFDLGHFGVSLALWYLFLGFPFAYGVTWLNREIIRWVGYEKIMRSPSGIIGSKVFFTVVSVIIITVWAIQISEEEKEKRILKLKEEAKMWNKACEVLEREKALMAKVIEASKTPGKLGSSSGMRKEPLDYYPPTPKDMIKEVMERRTRRN